MPEHLIQDGVPSGAEEAESGEAAPQAETEAPTAMECIAAEGQQLERDRASAAPTTERHAGEG
jgi:hypothetical protein